MDEGVSPGDRFWIIGFAVAVGDRNGDFEVRQTPPSLLADKCSQLK